MVSHGGWAANIRASTMRSSAVTWSRVTSDAMSREHAHGAVTSTARSSYLIGCAVKHVRSSALFSDAAGNDSLESGAERILKHIGARRRSRSRLAP